MAKTAQIPTRLINLLAISAVIFSSLLAVLFAGQLPLDYHSFRQTQTALTAYWFIREGYKLVYETPVAGYPWQIPFEFPIYQYIVAAISQTFGLPITAVGRLVSFGFLLLCLPVVWAINRRLSLPPIVVAFFAGLLFTTPIYVYWGRAILIETAALFFVLLAVKYFLDYLLDAKTTPRLLLFSFFMSLGMLQKPTTALPVLVVLAAVLVVADVKRAKVLGLHNLVQAFAPAMAIAIPVLVAFAWTHYTDVIKTANPLGQALTSAALASWNWGTPGQRFTVELWWDVLVMRILAMNLGWFLGLVIIAASFVSNASRRLKLIMVLSIAMGLLPLFMFTNLHIVHEYYQTSCVIFLTYALAVGLGAVVAPLAGVWTAAVLLSVLVVANLIALNKTGYLSEMMLTFGRETRAVAIGEILKRELPPDRQFVAFGIDWSSTLPYLSERKSFSVPAWFKDLANVIANPQAYVEQGKLGAVVACSDEPNQLQVLDWAASHGNWKVGTTSGCNIALPAHGLEVIPSSDACRGNIDQAEAAKAHGRNIVTIAGWTTVGTPPSGPDGIFVAIQPDGKPPIYLDTLRVPRLDANKQLKVDSSDDLGFSRVFATDLPSGKYTVSVILQSHGRYSACAIDKALNIPD